MIIRGISRHTQAKAFATLAMLVAACLWCPLAISESPCAGDNRETRAIRLVKQQLPADEVLQATAAHDLTAAEIDLQRDLEMRPSELRVVCFYRVELSRYQLTEGEVQPGTLQVDASSEWIVALEQGGDLALVLEGSKDPAAAFNELLRSLHLTITTRDAALDLFDLYVKAAGGSEAFSQIVGDDMMLQVAAIRDFRTRVSANHGRTAFESWWIGIPLAIRRTIAPPTVGRLEKGYEVTYYRYERGSIFREQLLVGREGVVNSGTSTTLH